jgi:hypothetical protein
MRHTTQHGDTEPTYLSPNTETRGGREPAAKPAVWDYIIIGNLTFIAIVVVINIILALTRSTG